MSRKYLALLITVVGGGLLLLVATSGSLISQIVESDGHRTTEMGILGSSFVVRTENVPGLTVKDEVLSRVKGIAPLAPGVELGGSYLTRIRRRSNTEWFAGASYSGDPKKIAAYYRKLVTPSAQARTGSDDVHGTLADGSNLWIYFDTAHKKLSFKLTKPGRGL